MPRFFLPPILPIVFSLMVGCSSDTDKHDDVVPIVVSPEWVEELLGDEFTGIVLDARSPEVYSRGHLAGAINLHSENT